MQERLIGKHMLTDCFGINFKPQFQSFCQIFKAQNFFFIQNMIFVFTFFKSTLKFLLLHSRLLYILTLVRQIKKPQHQTKCITKH